MIDKANHKYLVGFLGDHHCVYGKDEFDSNFGCKVASFTQPMTLRQAQRALKQLSGNKTIYELRPITNLAARRRMEMMAGKKQSKQ